MEDEIEYLSEEQLASVTTSLPNLYYVYFTEQGSIDAITNEKRSSSPHSFIEVEYKRVERFLVGKENFIDYIVSLVDKDTPVLVKKTEDAGANTNLLVNIDKCSTDNTLNVEWNTTTKSWVFYIAEEYKSQFKDLGLSSQLLFFVTLRSNSNFLVNSISIDMKDLINSKSITVPWKSKAEENISNISVSTRRFFDSYGIQVHE